MNRSERVRAAQGDAWQAKGRLFESLGGAVGELPGVRLMSSGLNQVGRNGGDVHEPDAVDLDDIRAWFAWRDVPWGLRVRAGTRWPHGRRLFRQRCMALDPPRLRPVGIASAIALREAQPDDADIVASLDATAFGGEHAASRAWIAPRLGAPGFLVALASLDGVPAGTATAVLTDEWAGPAVGIFGVGVLPEARRRGIGAALSSWLLDRAFADGATLAHLNPDSDDAARLYARLGFVETSGFDVYTGLSTST